MPNWDDLSPEPTNQTPQQEPVQVQQPVSQGPAPDWDSLSEKSPQAEAASTPAQTYLGGFENMLGTATAGLSKIAEQHPEFIPGPLGIAARTLKAAGETTPEKVAAREENLPLAVSLPATLIGGAGFGALTGGGALSLLPETAGSAARIAAIAGEGGAYNAIQGAASRESMGDPALNAEKIIHDAGWGSLIGAGAGALFETPAILKALRGVTGIAPESVESIQPTPTPEQGIKSDPLLQNTTIQPNSESGIVSDLPEQMAGKKPRSLKEIQDARDQAVSRGENLDLKQRQVVLDADSRLNSQYPINEIQSESLKSNLKRDAYSAQKENPDGSGLVLADYETLQRNEADRETDNLIKKSAGDREVTSNPVIGGNRTSKILTDQYQAEKNEVGPKIGALNKLEIPEDFDIQPQLVASMVKTVPELSNMFEMAGDEVHINPYSGALRIPRSTYNAVKEAITSLKENPDEFGALSDIRNNLDQHVNILEQGKGPNQIRDLKKSMMDFNQDVLDQITPDVQLRELNKRYAINEQERKVIEKNFGASVGSPEFGAISKVKPEDINNNIFNDTATVNAAKKILSPEDFNEIRSNWIAQNKAQSTTDNVFSSNKFGTFLKGKTPELNSAFEDSPSTLQTLKDWNDKARILPDAKSSNPPGTAKTFANLLPSIIKRLGYEDIGSLGLTTGYKVADELRQIFNRNVNEASINRQLRGASAINSVESKIANTASNVGNKITDGAKSLFSRDVARAVSLSALSASNYEENSKRIKELANNPQMLDEHLQKTTSSLFGVAPDIAQNIHTSLVSGINYLAAKIPHPSSELPMSGEWKPSVSQMAKFNRSFSAVQNPLSLMKMAKNGSINSDDIEAVQITHPQMLNAMRSEIANQMNKEKSNRLPLGTKIGISKLMGQPMDENMVPSSIQFSQNAFIKNTAQARQSTVKGMKNLNKSNRTETGIGESNE